MPPHDSQKNFKIGQTHGLIAAIAPMPHSMLAAGVMVLSQVPLEEGTGALDLRPRLGLAASNPFCAAFCRGKELRSQKTPSIYP